MTSSTGSLIQSVQNVSTVAVTVLFKEPSLGAWLGRLRDLYPRLTQPLRLSIFLFAVTFSYSIVNAFTIAIATCSVRELAAAIARAGDAVQRTVSG